MTLAPNLERGSMSRFQVAAILICTFINMMDGFDVLVIAFTAPAIATEWQLSGTVVGMLLSAGLVGMVIGSLALGPLAQARQAQPDTDLPRRHHGWYVAVRV
jgi:MFS family permease